MQLRISASIFAFGGLYRATVADPLNEAFNGVYAFALSAAEPILIVLAALLSRVVVGSGVYHAAASPKTDGVPAVFVQFDLNLRTPS